MNTMKDIIDRLAPFKLLKKLDSVFVRVLILPVIENLTKNQKVKDVSSPKNNREGLYFWLLNYDDAKYKIYIGKTTSFSKRLSNYTSEFQAHSPNDYKLQVFLDFIGKWIPSATLDLYFWDCDHADLNVNEKNELKKHKPLLNKLSKPSKVLRAGFREAFKKYYQELIMGQ